MSLYVFEVLFIFNKPIGVCKSRSVNDNKRRINIVSVEIVFSDILSLRVNLTFVLSDIIYEAKSEIVWKFDSVQKVSKRIDKSWLSCSSLSYNQNNFCSYSLVRRQGKVSELVNTEFVGLSKKLAAERFSYWKLFMLFLIFFHEELSFLNYWGHREVLFIFYDLAVLLVKELEICRYLVPLPEIFQVLKRQEFVLAV